MSVSVFAFVECCQDKQWQLYEAVGSRHQQPRSNMAPESWGQFNFRVYYEQSQERGLPQDLSPGLRTIIDQFFGGQINRPSWMTLAEIIDFYHQDKSGRYAHLDWVILNSIQAHQQQDIRVVFWAD